MTNISPDLKNYMNIHVQEAQWIINNKPKEIYTKRLGSQIVETQRQTENFESSQWDVTCYVQGIFNKINNQFLL